MSPEDTIERERVRHARTLLRESRKLLAAIPPPADPPDPRPALRVQAVALGVVLAAVVLPHPWNVGVPWPLAVLGSAVVGGLVAAGWVASGWLAALSATRSDRPSRAWLPASVLLGVACGAVAYAGARPDDLRPWAGLAATGAVTALAGSIARSLEQHRRARALWRLELDGHVAALARVEVAARCLAEAEADLRRPLTSWPTPVELGNAPAEDELAET